LGGQGDSRYTKGKIIYVHPAGRWATVHIQTKQGAGFNECFFEEDISSIN